MNDATKRDRPFACFVAGIARPNATELRATLGSMDIDVVEPPPLSHAAADYGTTVRETIRAVDFVIAWLGSDPPDPQMLVEVGVGIGLGKPVVALRAIGNSAELAIADIPTLNVLPTNAVALANILDGFLDVRVHRPPAKKVVTPKNRTRALGQQALLLLSETQTPGFTERDAVELIDQGLVLGGSTPVRSSSLIAPAGDIARPDLAVWLDELASELGNPTVIEVKKGLDLLAIPLTTRQIKRYRDATGAAVVLIVHLRPIDVPSVELVRFAGRRVNWISIDALFARWQNQSFAEIVRSRVRRTT